jgi:hypothetical protein
LRFDSHSIGVALAVTIYESCRDHYIPTLRSRRLLGFSALPLEAHRALRNDCEQLSIRTTILKELARLKTSLVGCNLIAIGVETAKKWQGSPLPHSLVSSFSSLSLPYSVPSSFVSYSSLSHSCPPLLYVSSPLFFFASSCSFPLPLVSLCLSVSLSLSLLLMGCRKLLKLQMAMCEFLSILWPVQTLNYFTRL